MSAHRWILLAAILVVFLAAVYVDLPSTRSFLGARAEVRLGIDLAGGARLLLCAPEGTG